MRLAVLVLLALPLCACESLVFKLPTRQGNVIEQKELDQLQLGMTRDQVKFILGTPIAGSVFRDDRWDYVGYYRNPRGKVYSRNVSLFFDGDNKLARMEGEKAPPKDEMEAQEAIAKDEKKAATEEERDTDDAQKKKGGVTIKQPPKQ